VVPAQTLESTRKREIGGAVLNLDAAALRERDAHPAALPADPASLRLRARVALLLAAAIALGVALSLSWNGGGSRAVAPVARPRPVLAASALLGLPAGARLTEPSATAGDATAALSDGITPAGDRAAYRVAAERSGAWRAVNPAQHLRSTFSAGGVSVRARGAKLGFALQAVGYGSSLVAVGAARPRASGDRVSYAHPGVSEWYANGPSGLEQGFDVARAPAGDAGGPLTLELSLTGGLRPSLVDGGRDVAFERGGRTLLRYTGLAARDAGGRELSSGLELKGETLLIEVHARGARYPVRIDPFVQLGEKLTATSESPQAEFGASVALSANGSEAVVGMPYQEVKGKGGAADFFTRTGSTWSQQQLVPIPAGGDDHFGTSIAMSATGDVALIGAPGLERAYIYTQAAGKWTQQAELTPVNPVGETQFGFSVALSADGKTAIVGGPGDNSGEGASWVYKHVGASWTFTQEVLEKGIHSNGYSVALSANGDVAVVGIPGDEEISEYYKTSAKGSYEGEFEETEDENGGPGFGTSVAVSADGNTVLAGGPETNSGAGAVWIFRRFSQPPYGLDWYQVGSKITAAEETGTGRVGSSVSLSADGSTALVGGRSDNSGEGAAWEFKQGATFTSPWSQLGGKITATGESGPAELGNSVALASEAPYALIGGVGDENLVGAAWSFAALPPSAETGVAGEPTGSTANLEGTINANGVSTECVFEWGPTSAYGNDAPCSGSSGTTPVAVSAPLTGLAEATTYHFRVVAQSQNGITHGADQTFATTAALSTGTTTEPEKPAEAELPACAPDCKTKEEEAEVVLTAKGSEGTGTVAVATYGSEPGGAPLPRPTAKYFDAYRDGGSTFKQVEVRDCELGGAQVLWWYSGTLGWQPIKSPTAVYEEGAKPCITVTVTSTSTPDLEQLTGTRFGTRHGTRHGSALGELAYGKCVAMAVVKQAGFFEDSKCQVPSVKNKGTVLGGKYEWFQAPVRCSPLAKAEYTEAECASRAQLLKTGFYEAGNPAFTAKGTLATFSAAGLGNLECKTSTAVGVITEFLTSSETLTFEGCKLLGAPCTSAGAASGRIVSVPIETYLENEGASVWTEFFGEPIATFSCGNEQYVLSGWAYAVTAKVVNTSGKKVELKFSPTPAGEQELFLKSAKGSFATSLTATQSVTPAQTLEINTKA
jgi:hypothetical protein